jgi:hypothetical protein
MPLPQHPRPLGATTGKQTLMVRLSEPTLLALHELKKRNGGLAFDAIIYALATEALGVPEVTR